MIRLLFRPREAGFDGAKAGLGDFDLLVALSVPSTSKGLVVAVIKDSGEAGSSLVLLDFIFDFVDGEAAGDDLSSGLDSKSLLVILLMEYPWTVLLLPLEKNAWELLLPFSGFSSGRSATVSPPDSVKTSVTETLAPVLIESSSVDTSGAAFAEFAKLLRRTGRRLCIWALASLREPYLAYLFTDPVFWSPVSVLLLAFLVSPWEDPYVSSKAALTSATFVKVSKMIL